MLLSMASMKYTFKQVGLDAIKHIRLGGQPVDTRGRIRKEYSGDLDDVSIITGRRIYVNIVVGGSSASWNLTITYDGKETEIKRPNPRTENYQIIGQYYSI